MGILSVLGRKPVVIEEPEPLQDLIDPDSIPTGPYLAVMEPDVAGISSFRLRFFAKAGQAEDFIATLRPDVRRGTHAFWAMHERPQPQEDMHIEALVLVRADQYSDIVYVVSFLDIESANSFTRFEVKRGLALENVLIYWAAFTQVREELDCVSIVTVTAPPVLGGALPVVEEPVHVVIEAAVAVDTYLERTDSVIKELSAPHIEDSVVLAEPPVEVLKPEPDIDSIIPEFSAPQVEDVVVVAETPIEVLESEPQIESIIPEFQSDHIDAPETDPDGAVLDQAYVFRHEETPVEDVVFQSDRLSSIEQEPVDAIALTLHEPDAPEELGARENECYAEASETAITLESAELATLAPDFVEQERLPSTAAIAEISLSHSLVTEGAEAGMIVESREMSGLVISYGGDEEVNRGPSAELLTIEAPTQNSPEPLPQGQRAVLDSGAAFVPQAKAATQPDRARPPKSFNIEQEVGRLLNNRRWEKRDSPFDGFNSPPGRF